MKKFALTLLLAVSAFTSWAQFDFSAVAPTGQTLYYNISGSNVTVTAPGIYDYSSYTQPTGSIIIPSTVTYSGTTYSVSSIGNYAFYECSSLTSVTIPNSVTSIGHSAFWECSSLTSVTIPNSVTSIGDYAFANCSNLTSVTIPNSVTSIGSGTFSACGSLTSVTIPNSVISIGNSAFGECSSLTSVTIPNSVTSIGHEAFSACGSLTSVTIPNSVTFIGGRAFWECSSLISVTIPNSVTYIGNYAFNHVRNIVYHGTATGTPWGALSMNGYVEYPLVFSDNTKTRLLGCSAAATSATIPNSVTSIGESAFEGCGSLTSVEIPSSVTSIGERAFYTCGLTSVIIPNFVTSIGESAFEGCGSLTNVTIGTSITSIGSSVFRDCSSLANITIPNSVTSIGSGAFSGCGSLISVAIPNSVTYIGNYAFNHVRNIVYHGTATGTPWGALSMNGYVEYPLVFSDNTKTRLLGCSAAATSATIPNSVTSINNEVFRFCSNLTSLTIGTSVTSIGYEAFSSCRRLDTIVCKASTPPAIVGYSMFYGVPYRCNVVIPCGSISSYRSASGWRSFTNYLETLGYGLSLVSSDSTMGSVNITQEPSCTNSTAVIAATPAPSHHFVSWSDGNTDNPRTINLTQDTALTAIFSNQYYDFSAVAPTGQTLYYKILSSHTVCVTHPGNSDFVYCWNGYTQPTGDLVIPSTVRYSGTTYSVTEIGQSAFYDCTGLTSITIPNSVTSINNSAFFSCDGLSSVTIPNSVTSIGDFAFLGCFSLTGVTIPRSVNSIGDAIFVSCVSLNYIIVDANNTHYDSRNNCNAIIETASNTLICGCQTTTIPNSVTSIGDNAFYNCVYLPSVTIPNSVTFIGNNAFQFCTGLTSVIIPNSVTSIGSGAFSGCGSLISVTIPNSVTYIGNNAFEYCGSLTSITCDAATAPALGESAFSDVPSSASVYIPCGSTASYQSAWGEYFSNFIEPASYSITASAADPTQGSAAAVIQPTCTTAVITATPAPDYHFRQWNDGNTDNPRTLTLTQDTSLTAFFSARPQHDTVYIHDTTYIHDTVYVTLFLRDSTIIYGSHDTIFVHDTVRDCHEQQLFVLVNNDTLGACAGSGTYPLGSTVQIMAIPNRGQRFLCWSDGVTTNPRTITLTGNLTFTAIFFKQDD